uniref:Bromo domain-containing protein n=1 Tax=Panagrolaimus sp. JU765 TaxID=591449 RepID=A0AC34RI68_9BILA
MCESDADADASFGSNQSDSLFLDDTEVSFSVRNDTQADGNQTVEEVKQLPEVKDEWRVVECLELMKLVNSLGKDFSQISTRLKSTDGMIGRPRNYFTPEVCEAMYNLLLAKTRQFPEFKEFFDQIYTEKAHVLWLMMFYQKRVDVVRSFLKDTLSDRKIVNLVKSYFANSIDDENKQKITFLLKKLYSLLFSTLPYDEFKDVDKSTTACLKIFTDDIRKDVNDAESLREKAMMKYMENLFKSELEIVPALNVPVKTPKSKISPPKVIPQRSPSPKKIQILSPQRKVANISTPVVDSEEPPKKKRFEQVSNIFSDLTPKINRGKKITNVGPKQVVKATPKVVKQQHRSISKNSRQSQVIKGSKKEVEVQTLLSLSKNSRQSQVIKGSKKEVEVQTLLCLVNDALEKTQKLTIYRPRKKEETKENEKRTVGTQTTKPFTMTAESIKWDDREIPCSDMTSKVYGACLRSDSKFIRRKTVTLNFFFNETGLKTYHAVAMRTHPCKMAFEQLKNKDDRHYFYNPVRFEATKYRRMIHRPMDLLTIEDLMVRKQINTSMDLFLHVALICANGVVFDVVTEESSDYFVDAAKCLKPFLKK